MIDALIIETGNGGDLLQQGNDMAIVEGFENMPYLAMFSGDGDWWGNNLLFSNNDSSVFFSSQTERVMREVTLNSAGRIKIETAIKNDLAFLKSNISGTTVDVTTSVVNPDRLDIEITINGNTFYMQWNPSTAFLNYQV